MGQTKTLTLLVTLIAVLAVVAAGMGVFYQGEGASYEFTSIRGEAVKIQGHGLYRYDPASVAAQGIAQDVVTLVVGIPLLAVSLVLYRRGQLRGHLLLAGTLGYFLYTYASIAFGAAFNPLFLVYVALFSLSLFALTTAMVSVDLRALPSHFSDRLPRRAIAIFMFAGAAFLILAWLGRIVPAQIADTPPYGLESNTTLFIQVLDLGLVVPVMILAGVTLLRRRPLGYLLVSVGLVKFSTMGLALIAMIIGMLLAGVPVAAAEGIVFPTLALAALVLTFLLLRNLRESRPVVAPLKARRAGRRRARR